MNPSVHTQEDRNWYSGEVYSVDLQRNFDATFGNGCKVKSIPDKWMQVKWNPEVFEAFIEGFYLGDGYLQ